MSRSLSNGMRLAIAELFSHSWIKCMAQSCHVTCIWFHCTCKHCTSHATASKKVSYPTLTVWSKQWRGCPASAQTPPSSGSARWRWFSTPGLEQIQHCSHESKVNRREQWCAQCWPGLTLSSSSSWFFLECDWFLLGNRKSSAAVGTPGNTATRSCSSGKSSTCIVNHRTWKAPFRSLLRNQAPN